MPTQFKTLTDFTTSGFDDIIDVRSPAEFAEDHVLGAINLPVLSNEERAVVGTMYTQESPFKARKIGAALVVRNVAQHLETTLAGHPKGWKPLVYCWRGGQRSGSMTWLLSQVGWRAEQLGGGYKTYRALVKNALYDQPFGRKVVLLDGNTGTAKTELLHLLAAEGVNILDLEGLANHRGSVFGHMAGAQPSQRMFERDVLAALEALPEGPVLIEAESSKVGDRLVPPALWSAMLAAPRIRVVAGLEARSVYLARAYADILADVAGVKATLKRLAPLIGNAAVGDWGDMAQRGAHTEFTRALMEHHYDPRYEKSRGRGGNASLGEIKMDDFSEASLAQATRGIQALFSKIT